VFDDVAVIGTFVAVLSEVLMHLQTAAVSAGLVTISTKTKYMRSYENIGEVYLLYIYIYKSECVCVCLSVCSRLTL
jgi:hypothetical protein